LKNLEKYEKNSSCAYGKSLPKCENCSRSNLGVVLQSQRSVLNREGINYTGESNRLGSRNLLNTSKSSCLMCAYCSEIGHA